jgi:hypothetical protein
MEASASHQKLPLQHFHFWCSQSKPSRRGFPQKIRTSLPSLCRAEVKMLYRARLRCIGFKHKGMSAP